MSDAPRVYSDEEFALVLRKAAELAVASDETVATASSSGLTLAEMQAAAAQAGIDPELVAQAARMLVRQPVDSVLARLAGGPMRHAVTMRSAMRLSEDSAARLLATVRISAGQSGSYAGLSSSDGVTWHDGGEMEALQVSAVPDGNGTQVQIALDRRGTVVMTVVFSSLALLMTGLASMVQYQEAGPVLSAVVGVAGTGATIAAVRAYWASSTRSIRRRINSITQAIGALRDGDPALPPANTADHAPDTRD